MTMQGYTVQSPKHAWLIALVASLLLALTACQKPVAMPDYPSEDSVRAAFAQIAIALAESDLHEKETAAWKVWLKPAENRADNLLRTANGALLDFELEDFAQTLAQMACSPDFFRESLANLRKEHPSAWRLLCGRLGVDAASFQPPVPAAPLFSGIRRQVYGDCRSTLTLRIRRDTEHQDTDNLRNHLVLEAIVVDLQSGMVIFQQTERLDQAWTRPLF